MENLRAWLNGCRDYASGAALYHQYGADPALRRIFSEPESEFKRKRLMSSLEDIWQKHIADPVPVPAPSPTLSVPPSGQTLQIDQLKEEVASHQATIEDLEWEVDQLTEETEDLAADLTALKAKRSHSGWSAHPDDVEAAIHAQWKPVFLEMNDLQSRLFEVSRAGRKSRIKLREAGKMALAILDLRDRVLAFYSQRDYYQVNGFLPQAPAPADECLDPKLYQKHYDNNMKYARTKRRELAALDPSDPKYLKGLQLLKNYEAKAEQYRNLLNQD